MLVGMDVCHQGHESITGFVASYNNFLSSYYTEVFTQKKGQEIVKGNKLKECMVNALNQFRQVNGAMPGHIIFYRDGVGDSMRDQVMHYEYP